MTLAAYVSCVPLDQVVLYFNDVKEGGETVFTKAPGIDYHDLDADYMVPVREVSSRKSAGQSVYTCTRKREREVKLVLATGRIANCV